MNEKRHIYLLCLAIILSSIILGAFIYQGLDTLGHFINDGLRVMNQNLAR